jgi:hypothetical protein
VKTKLTLSIDNAVTKRAKIVAKQRGISLSGMVEAFLEKEASAGKSTRPAGSFAERWRGKLVLSDRNDARTIHLKRKYGLPIDE